MRRDSYMQNLEKKKEVGELNPNFFIPLCHLYFDEALKTLKSNEFKTYMAILLVAKEIGPNTIRYYSRKKELFKQCSDYISVTEQTFLKHIKTCESMGLFEFERSNTLNIGFGIKDSKSYGFTEIQLATLIHSLDRARF